MVDIGVREMNADELDFSRSPLFAHKTSDRDEITGPILRLAADTKIHVPDQDDIDAKKGDVLFKSPVGTLIHCSKDDFAALFDRVLVNGTHVPLTKPLSVQLAEITHAGDNKHLIDFAQMTGKAAFNETLRLAGVGIGNAGSWADRVYGDWTKTEDGKLFHESVQQVRADFETGVKDFAGVAQTGIDNAVKRGQEILDSPEGQQVRQAIRTVRGKLGRLVGGGHEQGPSS